MKTRQLHADQPDDLRAAEALLRAGGIVAVPTETVYGLAANAANPEAVAAIFAAKGRPADHPLIVHIASAEDLALWATQIPDDAYTLAAALWPGPLTMLLKKAPNVTSLVTGGLNTIGIRVPAHPVLQHLLQSSGLGLAAPSANPYKQLSPTSAAQVMSKLDGKIDAVLDGGDCSIGLESTIVDLTSDVVRIVRVGPIAPSQVESLLDRPVAAPAVHQVAVPGNVDQHYQPRTPLHLVARQDLLAKMKLADSGTAFVVLADFAEQVPGSHLRIIRMPVSKPDFARSLYKTLYDLDQQGFEAIWFEIPPQSEEWLDVNDRLRRASYAGLDP